MKKLLLLTLVLINCQIFAQIKITGTIIDGITNETLIGANVVIKETKKGTATNYDGQYTIIHNGELPATLIVSYLGYKNLQIEILSSKPKPLKLDSLLKPSHS